MARDLAPELNHLFVTLRRFFHEVENQAIENKVYFDLILEKCAISHERLQGLVQSAQQDDEKRAEAHAQFAGMWAAIDQASKAAFFEEQLNQIPTTDKPN